MKINIVLLFFAMAINNGIEKPDYKVVKKYNNFELRDYGSIVIATTSLERNYSRSNSVGFQKVASYIFGGNDKNMKIAMTAPVMTHFILQIIKSKKFHLLCQKNIIWTLYLPPLEMM